MSAAEQRPASFSYDQAINNLQQEGIISTGHPTLIPHSNNLARSFPFQTIPESLTQTLGKSRPRRAQHASATPALVDPTGQTVADLDTNPHGLCVESATFLNMDGRGLALLPGEACPDRWLSEEGAQPKAWSSRASGKGRSRVPKSNV